MPDSLKRQKAWSEIVSNWVTALGIIGAIYTFYEWEVGRQDHAVDFLQRLDEKFESADVVQGREIIDWDEEYDLIKGRMHELAYQTPEVWAKNSELRVELMDHKGYPLSEKLIEFQCEEHEHVNPDKMILKVEACLRFYEFLNTVREEKQAPTAWLQTYYSYLLNQYYNADRKEFREYVDRFYPGLRVWLIQDQTADYADRYFQPRLYVPRLKKPDSPPGGPSAKQEPRNPTTES